MIKAVFVTSHSDIQAHLADLEQRLQGSRVLRTAATNLHALISFRVQNQGKLTSGALIGGGKYSPQYAKYRQSKGRQTAYIDLTLTGGMMTTGFNLVEIQDGYGIGFVNATEYAKYEYNTERYGEWALPNQQEVGLSMKDVINDTNDAIRSSSK